MIDVEEEHLAEIRRILSEHMPDCEVRAFGSRVEGKASEFSDLDLVSVFRQDSESIRILNQEIYARISR